MLFSNTLLSVKLTIFFWCRHTPLQIIHLIGNFFRIWSVYSMYRYLSQTGASVVLFIFSCLVPSSIIFLTMQKPWKGRPLSNTQVKINSTLFSLRKIIGIWKIITISMICFHIFLNVNWFFQIVPSIINGGLTALYFILWGKGLRTCGPVR